MKIIFFITFVISSLSAFSQWSGRVEYVQFTGFHNQMFKPTAGLVIQYSSSDKYDNFRYGITLGFRNYNTREDSYPHLKITDIGDGKSVALPYETVINKFYSFPLNIYGEYKFGDMKTLSPLIGGSGFLEANQLNYYDSDLYVTGSSYGFGLSTYIGAAYKLNDSFELTTRLTYEFTRESTFYMYSKWLFSIGITYYNY